MAHGDFVWCDLSTFDPQVTQPFYAKLFGWRYADDSGYAIASASRGPVAGLFPMPQKFRDIRMPSFWMSYVEVADIDAAVETARAHGGKVELGPAPFDGGGRYALIRDPLGAGFTIYQGAALAGATSGGAGTRLGHGLFVSDASAVIPFYAALFGWRFDAPNGGVQSIQNGARIIAHLHEIPDPAVRGKEQYWAVLFAGNSASKDRETISAHGGTVEAEMALPEGNVLIARDPNGAAFVVIPSKGSDGGAIAGAAFPWKAWLGVALIALQVTTGWTWLWAIFLGIWVWVGLRHGETYLFERVSRHDAPVLFWVLMGGYAVLALLAALEPLA